MDEVILSALARDKPVAAKRVKALVNEIRQLRAEADRHVSDQTREALAAYAHDAWSGWMRYLFKQGTTNADGSFTIHPWAVERWARQMQTAYADLSDDEKRSDLAEADTILTIVKASTE